MTASPLDYHLFRQEITSKYPAYDAPPPLIPIEPENNSILPPLPNHPSRRESRNEIQNMFGNHPDTAGSILNQAVHIATPAPSPPPSPAGPGGKGGKKQNYQTNQNFPFLHPPVGAAEGDPIGGNTPGIDFPFAQSLKERWDDSDVPASILEAGQLFSSRMRMSRSIRQLWDVRECYIRAERGWHDNSEAESDSSDDKNIELDEQSGSHELSDHKHCLKESHGTYGVQKSQTFLKSSECSSKSENEGTTRQLNMMENFYVRGGKIF